jgi:hypothetical protein
MDALQMAHIFIPEEEIYKGAQIASLVKKVFYQGRVLVYQVIKRFSDVSAPNGDFSLPLSIRSQGRWNTKGWHKLSSILIFLPDV